MADQPNNLIELISSFSRRLAVHKLPEGVRTVLTSVQALENRLESVKSSYAVGDDPERLSWLTVAAKAASYYQRNIPNWHQTTDKLSDESWFVGPCIGFDDCLTLIDTAYQVPEMVDDVFMRFYAQEIDNLSAELCNYFPNRAGIIRAAVNAHKDGNYDLSIPVFFSQTDGFCYDVHRSIFDGTRVKPEAVRKDGSKRLPLRHDATHIAEQSSNFEIDGFFLPILSKTPNIALNENDRREKGYHGLNRNAVLHGVDTTYGTEINSLKAFSYMVLVAGFIHAYKEEMNSHFPLQAVASSHQDPL